MKSRYAVMLILLMVCSNVKAATVTSNFDWDDHTWTPGTAVHTFTNVDSSGIDIVMTPQTQAEGSYIFGGFPQEYPSETNVTSTLRFKMDEDTIAKTQIGAKFKIEFFDTLDSTPVGVMLSDFIFYDIDQSGSMNFSTWQEQVDFGVVEFGGAVSDGTLEFSNTGENLNVNESTDTVGSKDLNTIFYGGDTSVEINPLIDSNKNRTTLNSTTFIQEINLHYTNITGFTDTTHASGNFSIFMGGFSFSHESSEIPPPVTEPIPTPAAFPAGMMMLALVGMRRRRKSH